MIGIGNGEALLRHDFGAFHLKYEALSIIIV